MPISGKVYHRFYALLEHVKALGIEEARKQQLLPLIERRWEMAHSHMHAAGYALDPEFVSHDYNTNAEVSLACVSSQEYL